MCSIPLSPSSSLYYHGPKFVTCPKAFWTLPVSCGCHARIRAMNIIHDKFLTCVSPEPTTSLASSYLDPFLNWTRGLTKVLGHWKSGWTKGCNDAGIFNAAMSSLTVRSTLHESSEQPFDAPLLLQEAKSLANLFCELFAPPLMHALPIVTQTHQIPLSHRKSIYLNIVAPHCTSPPLQAQS